MKGKVRFYSRYLLGAVAVLGSGLLAVALVDSTSGKISQSQSGMAASASTEQRLQLHQTLARLPLLFIENRGQVDSQVKFYAQGRNHSLSVTRKGLHFSLTRARPAPADQNPDQDKKPRPARADRLTLSPTQGPGLADCQTTTVSLTPLGLSRKTKLVSLEPQETRVNYFIGRDPQKWQTGLHTYKAVAYQEAYPGIDLKFYGAGQQLEYDIIVKPGADPSRVQFQYTGVKGLKITPAGDLAILLPDGGELIQKKPIVYQEINGARVAREAGFKLQGNKMRHAFGFEVAAYDRKRPLVIDPVLVYSTYRGSNNGDEGFGIALDAAGYAYVTGVTWSTSPWTIHGLCDAFVQKYGPDGVIGYMTFLGGNGKEEGHGIAVDAGGNAYVTGWTDSADFPCTNTDIAQSMSGHGAKAAFVARLNSQGQVDWSTVLGGAGGADVGAGIALGPLDSGTNLPYVYVTGGSNNDTFLFSPQAPPPLLYPYHGGGDAFVVKIRQYTAGQTTRSVALYYCFLGGGYGREDGLGIAVDGSDNAYITGVTFSNDMPAYPTSYSYHGAGDAFAAKINALGVMWSICIGGSGTDSGNAIALGPNNHIYVAGETYSDVFTNFMPSFSNYHGGGDAFVVKIRQILSYPSSKFVPFPDYFNYLGGSGLDKGRGIGVDSSGNAYVTGDTASPDFPVLNQLPYESSGTDAFVAKLNAAGTVLVYSTRLGGVFSDVGNAIAVQPDGVAVVTGKTYSPDFPTRVAYHDFLHGNYDIFVTRLDPRPLLRLPLPGLLAFYPFSGDEPIGQDASGNGRDAMNTDVVYGSILIYPFEGKHSHYNGDTAFLEAPVNINPSHCPRLTMGAWVRVYSPPERRVQVLSCDNGSYDRSLGIDYTGGTAYWSVFCGSAGLRLGPPVVAWQWVFLAAVYDQLAGTVTFWVNDQKITVTGATLGEGLNALDIGRNPGYGEYFYGDLDNVFIYKRALTDAQIASIRDGGANFILKAPPGGSLPFLEMLLSD